MSKGIHLLMTFSILKRREAKKVRYYWYFCSNVEAGVIILRLIWLQRERLTEINLSLLSGIPAVQCHLQNLTAQNLIVSLFRKLSLHCRNEVQNEQPFQQRCNIPVDNGKKIYDNKASRTRRSRRRGTVRSVTYEHGRYSLLLIKHTYSLCVFLVRFESELKRARTEETGCVLGDWVKAQGRRCWPKQLHPLETGKSRPK